MVRLTWTMASDLMVLLLLHTIVQARPSEVDRIAFHSMTKRDTLYVGGPNEASVYR